MQHGEAAEVRRGPNGRTTTEFLFSANKNPPGWPAGGFMVAASGSPSTECDFTADAGHRKTFWRWPMVRFPAPAISVTTPQDSRDVRDRLANAMFADADAVETLLFRTHWPRCTAIHALRHESLISRRQKKARAAATARRFGSRRIAGGSSAARGRATSRRTLGLPRPVSRCGPRSEERGGDDQAGRVLVTAAGVTTGSGAADRSGGIV
jgi:hypothetical protein